LRGLERYVIISAIDRNWQNHLTEMEDLRQSVSLRSYGQRDPLQEYKSEAFRFFEQMMNNTRAAVCTGIFRSATSVQAFQSMLQMLRAARQSGPTDPSGAPGPQAARPAPQQVAGAAASQATATQTKEIKLPKVSTTPKFIGQEPGRNDTVVIRKGQETLEVKYKKAKPMIEGEG